MLYNWVDILVLVLLVLFAGFGVWAGLIQSLFRLSAWVAGIAGVWFGTEPAMQILTQNIHSIPVYLAKILSVFACFALPFFVFYMIGIVIHRFISATPFSSLNRLGGGFLGLIKGLILCVGLLFLLHWLPAQGSLATTRESSLSYQLFLWAKEEYSHQL